MQARRRLEKCMKSDIIGKMIGNLHYSYLEVSSLRQMCSPFSTRLNAEVLPSSSASHWFLFSQANFFFLAFLWLLPQASLLPLPSAALLCPKPTSHQPPENKKEKARKLPLLRSLRGGLHSLNIFIH